MSYNSDYVTFDATFKEKNQSGTVVSTPTTYSFNDAFKVATASQVGFTQCNGKTCVVACGCNSGWTSTKPTSGNYIEATTSKSFLYTFDDGSSLSSYQTQLSGPSIEDGATTSSYQTSLSSNTTSLSGSSYEAILASNGTSLSGSNTTLSAVARSDLNGTKTCYKKAFSCGDGYIYYDEEARENVDGSVYEYSRESSNSSNQKYWCLKPSCGYTMLYFEPNWTPENEYDAPDYMNGTNIQLLSSPDVDAAETNYEVYGKPLQTFDTLAFDNGIKCYLPPRLTHTVSYYETYTSGSETCSRVVGIDFVRGVYMHLSKESSYKYDYYIPADSDYISDRYRITSIALDQSHDYYLFCEQPANSSEYYMMSGNEFSGFTTQDLKCEYHPQYGYVATACAYKARYPREGNYYINDGSMYADYIGNCNYGSERDVRMSHSQPYNYTDIVSGEEYVQASMSTSNYSLVQHLIFSADEYPSLTRTNLETQDDQGFFDVVLLRYDNCNSTNNYTAGVMIRSIRVPPGASISNLRFTARFKMEYSRNSGSSYSTCTMTYTNTGTSADSGTWSLSNCPMSCNSGTTCTWLYNTSSGYNYRAKTPVLDSIEGEIIGNSIYGLRYITKTGNKYCDTYGEAAYWYDPENSGVLALPKYYDNVNKVGDWGGRCTENY